MYPHFQMIQVESELHVLQDYPTCDAMFYAIIIAALVLVNFLYTCLETSSFWSRE